MEGKIIFGVGRVEEGFKNLAKRKKISTNLKDGADFWLKNEDV
jgi:hypothetical protein